VFKNILADIELISVKAAAEIAGVSNSAISRWIIDAARLRDGSRLKLRAVRMPAGFRTSETWISEFVDALTRDRTGASVKSEAAEHSARRAASALQATGW